MQVSSNLETLTLFIEASPYRARASRPLPEGEGDTTLLSASRQRRQAALVTGRYIEAGYILRTFAHYVADGLIPNMFPEGEQQGLYRTADATMWYFHAIERYLAATGDRDTLELLIPKLIDIIEHHIRGTRFGIGLDPTDGLLKQGKEGYQLTWMDAKVGDWVVTPRRGKTVEINALWSTRFV